MLLEGNRTWELYNCRSGYKVQVEVDNPKDKGWDERIHVFARGKSRADIDTMLLIYSTMRPE